MQINQRKGQKEKKTARRWRRGKAPARVLPGFGITLGVTVAMLSIVVIIPLLSLFWGGAELQWSDIVNVLSRGRVLASFRVSIVCALIAAAVNLVMGVLLAWVLTRYQFPGRKIIDCLIELPFALPTAIAGMTLASLTADTGWIGSLFAPLGLEIAYTQAGIVLALIFVGIPFVVRSVQPVLEQLDPLYEEAAYMMGASRWTVFRRVVWPELRPAALTGFGLALARGLGEYGSVVFIAGNQPFKTEIVSLMIMSQLEEYDYGEAAAIAVVMLALSFLLLFIFNLIQARARRRTGY